MTGFKAVLDSIEDLNLNQLHSLLHLAKVFKDNPSQINRLKGKRLCTFFLENSTRTKFSFQVAAQNLGMHILDVDPSKTSLQKGESLLETFRTFRAQGIDVMAIRSSEDGLLLPFKDKPPLALINAGDGKREHPTQALLDLLTLDLLFPKLKNLNVLIIGDCKHSRVAGSLCKLLPQFEMKVTLCGPDYFLPDNKLGKEELHTTDIESALKKADVIYLLRVQKERHSNAVDINSYIKTFGMTLDRVNSLARPIPVLHPGPFNMGIEIDEALVEKPISKLETGYAGYKQVENSVYMRMSILSHLLKESP
jgi:aspartate carbamoyltransferase catalytic subunit